MTAEMIMKYWINVVLVIIYFLVIALLFLIYFCRTNINRYVPTITISASSDGGKTYSGNLQSIPYTQNADAQKTDIYVKYEIKVKANGFWWRLFRNKIDFEIEYLPEFELYEYTGEGKGPFSLAASDKPKKAEILFRLKTPKVGEDYSLTLSFFSPVHKVYIKTVSLNFKDKQENGKNTGPATTKIKVNGDINVQTY
jgi:hypothetical protein